MTERAKKDEAGVSGSQKDDDVRLEECRLKIDALDETIVGLLNDRATEALRVGRLKDSSGMATYQPEREINVLEHVRCVNKGPLDGGAVTRLFERIIDENRRLERLAKRSDAENVTRSTEE